MDQSNKSEKKRKRPFWDNDNDNDDGCCAVKKPFGLAQDEVKVSPTLVIQIVNLNPVLPTYRLKL
jgi:hypothetical protein